LDISSNLIGIPELPDGWACDSYFSDEPYRYNGGEKHSKHPPSGSKFTGLEALADAIRNNGAMTSLNLASNELGVEGAKIIAACLPKCT
jgi:hypothetical protein